MKSIGTNLSFVFYLLSIFYFYFLSRPVTCCAQLVSYYGDSPIHTVANYTHARTRKLHDDDNPGKTSQGRIA